MKLERKHRQRIVLGIGIIIIMFGLLQALFNLEFDRKISDQVIFVLMIIAAALLFTKDKEKSQVDKITEVEKGNDIIETGTDKGNVKTGSESNSAFDDNAVKAYDGDDKITEESVDDEQSGRNY